MYTQKELAAKVEQALGQLLPETGAGKLSVGRIHKTLNDAMRYSLLSGGKRLRPTMLLMTVQMLGGDIEQALPAACALEMIHSYSLVHDDLPGMDDDVLRRGRPTNHVVFGVGQAILAGDGLLNLAYETLVKAALDNQDNQARHLLALREIARAAGVKGMISGQSLDLDLENQSTCTLDDLQFIQENKTAALFISALRAGGRLCGATDAQLAALTRFGYTFGMMFQTVDDLLDVEGDAQELGKSTGKDEQSGKLTAIRMYGIGGARELVNQYMEDGIGALASFGEDAEPFRALIRQMATRSA